MDEEKGKGRSGRWKVARMEEGMEWMEMEGVDGREGDGKGREGNENGMVEVKRRE